jgi:hypothetical protein
MVTVDHGSGSDLQTVIRPGRRLGGLAFVSTVISEASARPRSPSSVAVVPTGRSTVRIARPFIERTEPLDRRFVRSYHPTMPNWRCPHCRTPQPEAARCWVCRRSSTSCATCVHYRRSVAPLIGGTCGLDPRAFTLRGDERAVLACPSRRAPCVRRDPGRPIRSTSVRRARRIWADPSWARSACRDPAAQGAGVGPGSTGVGSGAGPCGLQASGRVGTGVGDSSRERGDPSAIPSSRRAGP